MIAVTARILLVTSFLFLVSGCGRGGMGSPIGVPRDQAWVSSGGEIFRDRQNPWWVKNTKRVTYCIAIDEAGISAPRANVIAQVEKAIAYWRGEFAYYEAVLATTGDAMPSLGIGAQDFVAVACDGREDLRFQFGDGTLSPAQRAFLKDPRQYVGIAVRTHYDPVELRGRGFLFIASDRGPGSRPPSRLNAKTPWSSDIALFLAIVHELGHVFGIPHVGDKYTLMSAEFPELLMMDAFQPTIRALREYDWSGTDLHFFIPGTEYSTCTLRPAATSFFSLSTEETCLRFRLDYQTETIAVAARPGKKTEDWRSVGTVDARKVETVSSLGGGVIVFLTPRQNVFKVPDAGWPVLYGPHLMKWQGTGFYRGGSGGNRRPVFLQLAPSSLEVAAELNGEMKEIVKAGF